MSEVFKTVPAESMAGSASLDADAVRAAYRRWAGIYDYVFGAVSASARAEAVAAVNRAPGVAVLEVGVGTGLALPLYQSDKRITGIDLSAEMLDRARSRVRQQALANVDQLLELDAEDTGFETGRFDIAVAMFVASVVPHPIKLAAELRRVVRPGGTILFVNHFASESGPVSWVERAMAPASRALGWHPDFAIDRLIAPEDAAGLTARRMRPFGLFRLVSMINPPRVER
ncbi:class I SAM-dependent methyltransferase [Acidiphilium sp.]|uniref:class I SAM-dependent methyltransferase n=1 Tax=Acidiphilium sp. TaxID=527 RepID=UPI003CFD86A6